MNAIIIIGLVYLGWELGKPYVEDILLMKYCFSIIQILFRNRLRKKSLGETNIKNCGLWVQDFILTPQK